MPAPDSSKPDISKTNLSENGDSSRRPAAPPPPLLSRLRANEIGGRAYAAAHSAETDKRLRALATEILGAPSDIALVALGGYGRNELCPFSDVDLLFLVPEDAAKDLPKDAPDNTPDNAPENLQQGLTNKIETFLYALWDSGTRVGHAVRSAQDCVQAARSDIKTWTTLLDARLIYGPERLFADLTRAVQSLRTSEAVSAYIEGKLEEREIRHRRLGDSRYVLEPDVKEGKGALRDYQTLIWVAHVVYGAKSPEDLARTGILSRKEARHFSKAHDYLLTVRCHLHDITGRAEERLHFDVQPALARRLGYDAGRSNMKDVERFMKHYFLTTRDIGNLTRILCVAIESANRKDLPGDSADFHGFRIRGERLDFRENQDLNTDPQAALRLFRTAQTQGYDLHPAALRLIGENLRPLSETLRTSPRAGEIFREILLSRNDCALTLRRMHESGLLGRLIPAFGRISCLMQFDRYHVFTVDEHTLRAVNILHAIENGEKTEEAPLAARLARSLPPHHRAPLFAAMFLHDICKGRGGDHSTLGAALTQDLGPWLGLSPAETDLAAWLVDNHLALSHTALRRDLTDPATARNFAAKVQSAEKLDLLAILTTADIMAVGPGRWTAWKAHLIEELYLRTLAVLTGAESAEDAHNIPEKSPASGMALARPSGLPEGYMPGQPLVTVEGGTETETTRVTVCTPDRPGLFSILAGGLAAAGADILAARIETLPGGTALDSFEVQNLSGRPFSSQRRREDIRQSLLRALEDGLDIDSALKELANALPARDHVFPVTDRIRIDNQASATDTVIEITTRDRPGLLYTLAKTLKTLGLDVRGARISTLGLRAVDVFYVRDIRSKGKLPESSHAACVAELRRALSGA